MPASLRNAVAKADIKYMLLHELAHLKRKDNIVNLITNILQILHWFNPMIWYGFIKMRDDRELACDATVLYHLNESEVNSYGKAIVNLLKSYTAPRKLPGLTGILEKKSQAKRRIERIARFNRNTYKWSTVAILVLLLMSCSMLSNPKVSVQEHNKTSSPIVSAPEDYVSDIFTVSTEVIKEGDLENLYIKAGYLDEQDDWTYFYGFPLDREEGSAYSLKSGPIYRIKSDGTSKTEIVSGNVEFIDLQDDWLYYKESDKLYRINLKSGDKSLVTKGVTGDVVIEGDWIYFSTGELKKIKTDGSEQKTIINEKVNNFILHEGWIYYITGEDAQLVKVDVNGTEKSMLIDRLVDNIAYRDNILFYYYRELYQQHYTPTVAGTEDFGNLVLIYKSGEGFDDIINDWFIKRTEGGGCRVEKINGNAAFDFHFYNTDAYDLNIDDEWVYLTDGNDLLIASIDGLTVKRIVQTKAGVFDSDDLLSQAITDAVKDNSAYKRFSIYEDENWIYYMIPNMRTINRISTDYKVNMHIASGVHNVLGVYNDWIYFISGLYQDSYIAYSLLRVKLDGTGLERVNNLDYNEAKIIGDWVYGTGFDKIHKIKLDGTEETIVYDGQSQMTIFADEWIYFQSADYYLHRIRYDGTGLEKVSSYGLVGLGYMIEYEGWIYYRITSSYQGKENGLYRIKGDGSRTDKLIGQDYNSRFVIYNDWIYYTKDTEIYKMKLNGEGKTKIYDNDTYIFSIIDLTENNIIIADAHSDETMPSRFTRINLDDNSKVEILDLYDIYGRETS